MTSFCCFTTPINVATRVNKSMVEWACISTHQWGISLCLEFDACTGAPCSWPVLNALRYLIFPPTKWGPKAPKDTYTSTACMYIYIYIDIDLDI